MTTYPLSEPATIYAAGDDATDERIIGHGTLADCAEIIEGLPARSRTSARIEMDAMDLRFGAQELDELLRFLREESAGLSNHEIAAIPDPDR